MIDEQIIEKAKSYSTFIGSQGKSSFGELYDDAFIAGAHSRDEEIEQLEKRIKVLDINLVEQQLENQQLRNPWISVEERLPELEERVVVLNKKGIANVSCRVYHKWRGVDTNWEWVDSWHWDRWQKTITHWMPIPELKKGK